MRKHVNLLVLLMAAVLLVSSAMVVLAKDWPSRPVNVVVGFGAGGFTDLFARMVADEMAKDLGVSFSVVNMPGGTGGIAAEYVRQAKHDGYTIWAPSDALRLQAVMGYHKSTVESWTPFITAAFSGVVSVRADSPFKSFDQVVKALKADQGSVTASASSPGTTWQTELEIISKYTGLKFKFIPYAGSHPSQVAAMGGEVDVVLTGIGEQAELLRAGKLRPLAVFDNQPYEFPGVGAIPPITDFMPELAPVMPFGAWVGLAVPNDLPQDVLAKLTASYQKAVQAKKIQEFAATNHCKLLALSGPEAVKFVQKDTSLVSWLLYELGSTQTSPAEFNIPKP